MKQMAMIAKCLSIALLLGQIAVGEDLDMKTTHRDDDISAGSWSEFLTSYAAERSEFQRRTQEARTDANRQQVLADMRARQAVYSQRALEIGSQTQSRDEAFETLTWIVANDFVGADAAGVALKQLAAQHIDNERLVSTCQRLVAWGESPDAEMFLRDAMSSGNRSVAGYARFCRAMSLRQNPERMAEVETMLTEVAKTYDDVPGYRGMLSETAAAQLFELQNLAIGKVAPEIVGVDLDGREMRLSDYRGSVVMIHFWGSWCRRCAETIPGERSLVKELKNQPFVMLGVNNDEQSEAALRFASQHEMEWKSWFDGPATTGVIAAKWNIIEWPTSYVLDHEGTIRAKFLGAIPPEVESFVKELTTSVSQSEQPRYVWKVLLASGVGFVAVGLLLHWRNRTPEAVRL